MEVDAQQTQKTSEIIQNGIEEGFRSQRCHPNERKKDELRINFNFC